MRLRIADDPDSWGKPEEWVTPRELIAEMRADGLGAEIDAAIAWVSALVADSDFEGYETVAGPAW